jgi:hypothetical protein
MLNYNMKRNFIILIIFSYAAGGSLIVVSGLRGGSLAR